MVDDLQHDKPGTFRRCPDCGGPQWDDVHADDCRALAAALAPVLAVRHAITPDGTACRTADAFAAVEFTASRVTCPACLDATTERTHLDNATTGQPPAGAPRGTVCGLAYGDGWVDVAVVTHADKLAEVDCPACLAA